VTLPRFPAHLGGKPRADRLMSTLIGVVALYRKVSGISGRRRPTVTEVDRDLLLTVEEVLAEAESVVSLRLVLARGGALPKWRPGAHLDLVLPSGRVRQYSLCGDENDRSYYRVAVRRIEHGDGGSREVHDVLRPGSVVTARGPRNAFPFVTDEKYLFIAGGIGITPILPMVRRAAALGADWRLVYTGRETASMPFLGELAAFGPERVWIRTDAEYGVPAAGAELMEGAPAGANVYCCGPIPMLTSVRVDAVGSAKAVFFERFSKPPIVGGKPFRVELARTGVTLDVPADRSVLDVVQETLPDVVYSCRQGFCGTCEVPSATGEALRICVDRSPGGVIILDL